MSRGPDPASLLTPLAGRRILFVMATEQEFGPELRKAICALMTGVGPVEAAIHTAEVLGALRDRDRLPDLVVSLGSAGSRTLEHAAVYQAASVSYRDMDASPLGFARGVTPFLGEPATVPIDHRLSGISAATLSTGAEIISGARYDTIDTDMVDMETYAVLRAAQRVGLPMIGLRGISDGRSALTGLTDWTATLGEIDAQLAAAVRTLEADLQSGHVRL
jgi:adenosylhomocysteine nucleosidase